MFAPCVLDAANHAPRGPTIFSRFGLVKEQSSDHPHYASLGSWKDPRATDGLVGKRVTMVRTGVASPDCRS